MKRLAFHRLPILAQLMTMASIFMAWVLVEEFEIDRHHLDRYLPFYKVGNLCVYDLAVASLLLLIWFGIGRTPGGSAPS